jgi:DNA-binding transcriptional MerR regulator
MGSMTIGTASRESGLHVETIRYYERIGLLGRTPRTPSGRRSFGTADLDRLRLIRSARELGFGLDVVRELIRLLDEKNGACAEVYRLAQAQIGRIDEKLAVLSAMRSRLAALMEPCADPGPGTPCPILVAMSSPDCCLDVEVPAFGL